jgi:flagellar protein FliO/FliZ
MSGRRVILLLLLAGGVLGLASVPLVAADKPAPVSDAGGIIYPASSGNRNELPSARSGGYSAVLVAAFLLAGAGAWLFWRGRTAPGGIAPVRKLAVAETKSLGNRQYLVVASYEDKKYLLGVCPGRIELLTALEGTPPAQST